MLEDIGSTLTGWVHNVKDWWHNLNTDEKKFVGVGGCLGVVLVAGGLVLQGFLIGALVNGFFWYGFWGDGLIHFMQRGGWFVDAGVTIGVMFISGVHAMIAGVFIAGIFSVCRRTLVPTVAQESKDKKEKKKKTKDLPASYDLPLELEAV